jgi:hypothetical protein
VESAERERQRQGEIQREVDKPEADTKRKEDAFERKLRRETVSSMEKSVTKDARKDVTDGPWTGQF